MKNISSAFAMLLNIGEWPPTDEILLTLQMCVCVCVCVCVCDSSVNGFECSERNAE